MYAFKIGFGLYCRVFSSKKQGTISKYVIIDMQSKYFKIFEENHREVFHSSCSALIDAIISILLVNAPTI